MIPLRTGISIGTHGSHGYDADRATGILRVFIFRMSLVYVHGYLIGKNFIPTGIYDKVISTLENLRVQGGGRGIPPPDIPPNSTHRRPFWLGTKFCLQFQDR